MRLAALLLLLLPLMGRAQFMANPVVLRIGDGTTTLSMAAAPVSLLEYSSTDMLVGTPVALAASGATSKQRGYGELHGQRLGGK